MMKIGSMTGAAFQETGSSTQAGRTSMQMQTDPVSKNIQTQIANAQKQLQDISADKEMPAEQKMKKRQEIQQEITSLNQQLRQHQIEQRKEQQTQAKSSPVDEMSGREQSAGNAKSGDTGSGLSQASMKAMMSADSSMKQARIQGNAATMMEGRAGVLKAEIKQGGGDIEAKQAELAQVEQKATDITASQMNTLAEVNQTIEEAAKTAQDSTADTKAAGMADTKAANKADENDKTQQGGKETDKISEETVDSVDNPTAAQSQEMSTTEETQGEIATSAYKHIDIRL